MGYVLLSMIDKLQMRWHCGSATKKKKKTFLNVPCKMLRTAAGQTVRRPHIRAKDNIIFYFTVRVKSVSSHASRTRSRRAGRRQYRSLRVCPAIGQGRVVRRDNLLPPASTNRRRTHGRHRQNDDRFSPGRVDGHVIIIARIHANDLRRNVARLNRRT